MRKIAASLVKWRCLFVTLMAACAVISVFLVPKINIVTDMTTFLPDDSRMREGMEIMKNAFPGLDTDMATVSVMGAKEGNGILADDSIAKICDVDGIASLTSRQYNDTWTLYQFSVERGFDCQDVANEVKSIVPQGTVVESNSASLLPDNMMFILALGCSMVLVILLIMCSSWVEALLFLIAIGIAVLINMGTNAFLPGVSMVTNTIVAVLQLVLSMDYSIILMNRYRQERRLSDSPAAAMKEALYNATPSVMSSALTTIVGLAMLVFMKFKIGMDLGVVLSKGVLCSLLSIYTVLPALVVHFDKDVFRFEKKVPLPSTDGLARFEMKFRIPLAISFVLILVVSYILHKGTEISFSSTWPTAVTEQFPPKNPIMMLYPSDKGEEAIKVIDSLAFSGNVEMALSYHSIMDRRYTAGELPDALASLSGLAGNASVDLSVLDSNVVRLLYYAHSHPVRDERMSIGDMMELAESISGDPRFSGLVDIDALMMKFSPAAATPAVAIQILSETDTPLPEPFTPDVPVHADSCRAVTESQADTTTAEGPPLMDVPDEYGEATRQLSSAQMAQAYGLKENEAKMIYRMAGRSGTTMSPVEFFDYISENVIGRRLYSSMISVQQKAELAKTRARLDSIVLAGPPVVTVPPAPDSLMTGQPSLPDIPAPAMTLDSLPEEKIVPTTPITKVEDYSPDPMDDLLDLAASGREVTAQRLRQAIRRTEINIPDEYIDLMYLYHGAINNSSEEETMSLSELLSFVKETLATDSAFSLFANDDIRVMVENADSMIEEGFGKMLSDDWSVAAFVTDYPLESAETFDFIRCAQSLSEDAFEDECYLIGESVMYKEMKDGFSRELLLLTILTALAIFIIVAISFRSFLIPLILVMTVLSAVFVNVTVSGIGGRSMLYLAYLIVQSILMGATIDYGILFTNYYREKRRTLEKGDAVKEAYRSSIHTIMTSGLIIVCVPFVMSMLIEDATISAILSSLTIGALAALILILLILPGILYLMDKIICKKTRLLFN